MKHWINLHHGKIGRLKYFLSLLILTAVFYYLFEFHYADRCFVCNPIMSFPWRKILFEFVCIALGGYYYCILYCLLAITESFTVGYAIMPILFTIFYVKQTFKRFHDLGVSGWWSLIPMFSLVLLLRAGKDDGEHHSSKMSILMKIWDCKWYIVTLVGFFVYIYLENKAYIHMHKSI